MHCEVCGNEAHEDQGPLAAIEPLWWHDVPALDVDHEAHVRVA